MQRPTTYAAIAVESTMNTLEIPPHHLQQDLDVGPLMTVNV